jgi:hypothetical protein
MSSQMLIGASYQACPTLEQNLCYDATDRITNLLDQKHIRKVLGVPEDYPGFKGCNNKVNSKFHQRDDDVPTIGTFVSIDLLGPT